MIIDYVMIGNLKVPLLYQKNDLIIDGIAIYKSVKMTFNTQHCKNLSSERY